MTLPADEEGRRLLVVLSLGLPEGQGTPEDVLHERPQHPVPRLPPGVHAPRERVAYGCLRKRLGARDHPNLEVLGGGAESNAIPIS